MKLALAVLVARCAIRVLPLPVACLIQSVVESVVRLAWTSAPTGQELFLFYGIGRQANRGDYPLILLLFRC